MSLNITAERPRITWSNEGEWDARHVEGTGEEWDWLFAELGDKYIASIKLIRHLNPGIGLRDAKEAYEAMKPHRNRR